MLTGYLHPDYPASFLEFATPCPLPGSQGWILERRIPGASSCDAMGCYPLFCCVNWRALREDLDTCCEGLVSIVLVADPLGDYSPEMLRAAFDHVVAFKDHFVVETGRPLAEFVNKSHRAHAMRALKDVSVELCPEPVTFIDDWQRLYGVLALRHSITGLRRFSRTAFEKQLAVPGMVMFRAIADGQTVGLDLWYEQGDCAQGHLAAFDSRGYELHASYATKWRAIDYFSDRVHWINLGAGTAGNPDGGLSQFKRGWSTGTKTAWLCGRVLQPPVYTEIVKARGMPDERYFPAYRSGEFE
jgi:hypothetical protein